MILGSQGTDVGVQRDFLLFIQHWTEDRKIDFNVRKGIAWSEDGCCYANRRSKNVVRSCLVGDISSLPSRGREVIPIGILGAKLADVL